MRLTVFGTGSAGNAYALTAGGETLLLDAGLPIKRIVRAAGDWQAIAACLITHEHGDHAKAAADIARMGIKTIASAGTIAAIQPDPSVGLFTAIQAGKTMQVGGFTILAFETQHDAAEPLGFLIRSDATGETVLYATDTYYLRHTFPGVNYWIVECNYLDEEVDEQAEDGNIAAELRNRLKKSHMSLRRLITALKANDLTKTRAIVLVHLSDGRSNERVMIQAIQRATGIEEVYAADAGQTIPLTLSPF